MFRGIDPDNYRDRPVPRSAVIELGVEGVNFSPGAGRHETQEELVFQFESKTRKNKQTNKQKLMSQLKSCHTGRERILSYSTFNVCVCVCVCIIYIRQTFNWLDVAHPHEGWQSALLKVHQLK